MIFRLYILLLLIFSFFSLPAFNQEEEISAVLHHLKEITQKGMKNVATMQPVVSSDSSAIVSLSKIKTKSENVFDDSIYFAAQRNALRKQTFLDFSSHFVQNFNPTQKDVEDNILYQRRLQNSLNWDMLKDGFFETKSKIRSLALEEAFINEAKRFSYKRVNFPAKMNATIVVFNARKNTLLEERKQLLNEERVQMEKLYFLKKITRETMLKLHAKLAEVEALKEIYSTYNAYKLTDIDSAIFKAELPLFDVNYQTVQAQSGNYDTLKMGMLHDLEIQNNWFRQIKVNTYLRHSLYDLITTTPATRSFFSAGLGISIPLTFNSKENLEAEKQKMLKRFDELETTSLNNEIDLLNETYEYRYHLKQYVLFYQKKQLVLEELRQERVKAKLLDADYNPVNALSLIDQLYQIEVELLDINQNLYIRLLKIQEKAKLVPIEKLIVPFKLPNFDELEANMYRSVYIWSKTVESQTVDFLTEYLIYNNFDEAIIAVSLGDTLSGKKKVLMDALFAKGVKITVMFGQNKLLQEEDKKSFLLNTLKELPISEISCIHLDVEPHTLEEWKINKNKLQEKYLQLVTEAKEICQTYSMKLTVDLPLHLDSSYLVAIAPKVDGIRLMCYENIQPSYLNRKIKFFQSLNTPISISLRTEDFSSRSSMESFAKEIGKLTSINSINFHDLNRLINLDQQPLKSDEEH